MMTSHWPRKLFALLIIIVVIFLVYEANYRYAKLSPGGSDFLPRWLGTRLLITEGQNPYGDESTLAIQTMFYGGPAGPTADQVLFVYPLYSSLIFTPFALIGDYMMARAAWMTILQAALVLIAVLSLRLANWRPSVIMIVIILLFILLWYHSVRPLINGNAAIMSALFITISLFAIRAERDFFGGFFLAFSTIKPQIVILLIPLTVIWAIRQRRWNLIIGLAGTLALFVIVSSILVPTWIVDNLNQIMSYPTYTLPGTPGAIFSEIWPTFGQWIGLLITIIVGSLLLWMWYQSIDEIGQQFIVVALITLAATNLVGVRTTTANYIVLFPGLIFVFAYLSEKHGNMGSLIIGISLFFFLFGLWFLFLTTRSGRMQSPVMFFPLPIYLLVMLLHIHNRLRLQSNFDNVILSQDNS